MSKVSRDTNAGEFLLHVTWLPQQPTQHGPERIPCLVRHGYAWGRQGGRVEKSDSLVSTRPFLALETQQDKWKIEEGPR